MSGGSTSFAAWRFIPDMATPIWAPPTIRVKREHTSLLAPVMTRPTLLFTPRYTIAPPSTVATATFPPTLTLRLLAVVISGRTTLPDVSEISFTNRVLTAVRGHPRRIHFQM